MINFEINPKSLPQQAGVYFWKDQAGQILYIGKAKNIQKRISEYLDGALNSYKTQKMLAKARQLDFIVTTNEKEALLLEQELIKKHRPYYNILLLDDKKYPFIVISLKNKKLEIKTRFYYKESKNTFYYGPLPTGYGSKVIRNFLVRECLFKDGLPIENQSPTFWKNQFNYAKTILSSSNQFIIKKLKNQLQWAIENEQFEIAKEIHETLTYLDKKNQDQQAIDFKNHQNFDVIAFITEGEYLLITIHHFTNGIFSLQEDFVVEIKTGMILETITEFINQFYKIRNKVKKIITNYLIESWKIFFETEFIIPQKGKYYQALQNAIDNTKVNLELKINSYQNQINKTLSAQKFLEEMTKTKINDFLMIDNSHFANNDIVSVLIYYKNFQPFYQNYRKYSIESSVKIKADIAYLEQGLTNYLKNENNQIPQLLIVDGAKAQIDRAKQVLAKFKIEIPVIGLVKNDEHKTNYLLDQNYQRHHFDDLHIYHFFAKIQTEVDQFAKNYHQQKRLQNSLEGFLINIEGIGPKIEEKLLKHFKTYNEIFNATEEQLTKVVSQKIALKIIKKTKNGV